MLGLTGSAGAGKSTAAAALASLGCAVIDVDRMGHEALDREDVRQAVVREFGPACSGEDGRLDRARLAATVFADEPARRRLEAIVHPGVRRQVEAAVESARAQAPRGVVIDCALLFEGGLDALCDVTVVVEAEAATRERRVAARGWSAEDLRRREAAQLSAAQKRARADRVVANDGTVDDLRRSLDTLLGEIAPRDRGREIPAAGRSNR